MHLAPNLGEDELNRFRAMLVSAAERPVQPRPASDVRLVILLVLLFAHGPRDQNHDGI